MKKKDAISTNMLRYYRKEWLFNTIFESHDCYKVRISTLWMLRKIACFYRVR